MKQTTDTWLASSRDIGDGRHLVPSRFSVTRLVRGGVSSASSGRGVHMYVVRHANRNNADARRPTRDIVYCLYVRDKLTACYRPSHGRLTAAVGTRQLGENQDAAAFGGRYDYGKRVTQLDPETVSAVIHGPTEHDHTTTAPESGRMGVGTAARTGTGGGQSKPAAVNHLTQTSLPRTIQLGGY